MRRVSVIAFASTVAALGFSCGHASDVPLDGAEKFDRTGTNFVQLRMHGNYPHMSSSTPLYKICISPKGDRVAAIDQDNVLHVWDSDSGKLLMKAQSEHAWQVTGLEFLNEEVLITMGVGCDCEPTKSPNPGVSRKTNHTSSLRSIWTIRYPG